MSPPSPGRARGEPLSAAQRLKLEGARALPAGHHKPASLLRPFSAAAVHDAERVIRESGVLAALDERLHSHPGLPSKITSEMLLVPALLNIQETGNYVRSDVAKAMACLDVQYANDVGLIGAGGWDLPSCRVIYDQVKRLERAFEGDGWIAKDGTRCGLKWFAHELIAESIPSKIRKKIGAIAVDSTAVPTWAVTKLFTPEKELRAAQKSTRKHRITELLEQDPMVEHFKAAADDPDLVAPVLPAPKKPSNRIGEMGPDGRYNRGLDYAARPAYRSATASRKGGPLLGYDFHFGAAVPEAYWRGDPRKVYFRADIPAYITHMTARSGLDRYGDAGFEVFEQSRKVAPNLRQGLADRAYTRIKEGCVDRVHRLRMDLAMDYDTWAKGKTKSVYLGKEGEPATEHCGTLLHKLTPQSWWLPPEDMEPDEKAEWFAKRFDHWAWRINHRLDDGGLQLLCPQCAGYFTSTAKTRLRQSAASKRSARSTRTTTPVPDVHAADAEWCCSGYAKAECCDVGNVQGLPHATPAWYMSYLRRLRIETRIGVLKVRGAFEKGWVRTFGLEAHTIAGVLAVVAHNLELTREANMLKRQQSEQRRREKLAATGGTEDGDPGSADSPSDEESDSDADGDDTTASRAPP